MRKPEGTWSPIRSSWDCKAAASGNKAIRTVTDQTQAVVSSNQEACPNPPLPDPDNSGQQSFSGHFLVSMAGWVMLPGPIGNAVLKELLG